MEAQIAVANGAFKGRIVIDHLIVLHGHPHPSMKSKNYMCYCDRLGDDEDNFAFDLVAGRIVAMRFVEVYMEVVDVSLASRSQSA